MREALIPASDHPDDILAVLRGALDGGPAIQLGGGPVHQISDRIAAVITTSGSTGYPKSVLLSREALLASAQATRQRLGVGVWLCALPLTRIAGVQACVRTLVAGADPVVLSPAADAEQFHRVIAGVTQPVYLSLVPAQLERLLGEGAAASLRECAAVLIGGQALAPSLRHRAADAGIRVVRSYGSTETSGGCVYDGVPLDTVTVRSDEGRVFIAGPMLADGYAADPDRTAAAFVTDAAGQLWYDTGDQGSVVDGVLTITGRSDRVFISGGVNVSLDRIERIVQSTPELVSAVVVAVPDQRWGEVPVVVAEQSLHADPHGDERLIEQVRSWASDQLGVASRPTRLVRIPKLPSLPSGKPDYPTITTIATAASSPNTSTSVYDGS